MVQSLKNGFVVIIDSLSVQYYSFICELYFFISQHHLGCRCTVLSDSSAQWSNY